MQVKEIYLAGGCFWGTEHFLKLLTGVTVTEVGYANGITRSPSYTEVKTGTTLHAETVRTVYDPDRVTLLKILELFFKTIDPTSLNQQGGDCGTQYRTGIYYTHPEDLPVIETALRQLARNYAVPLAVEVKPLENYYSAEDYHQDYLDKNPEGYCHIPSDLFELARKN